MCELIVFRSTYFQWIARIKFLLSRGWKLVGTIGIDGRGVKYQVFMKIVGGLKDVN